jgi:hypothetical protein
MHGRTVRYELVSESFILAKKVLIIMSISVILRKPAATCYGM